MRATGRLIIGLLLAAVVVLPASAETIPLQQSGGVYMLPVRINDAITIPFVLDSGSAEVAIPLDVFSVLRRTGTIAQSDFLGTGTYTLADGSTTSSDRYVIHKIAVGNVVSNVIANVAPVQGDPLLGQSFLSKLPGWAMDNAQHALILRDEDRTGPSPRRSVQPQAGMAIVQRPSSSPLPPGVPAPPTENRDEYLAYLETLVHQHIGLLPMSFVGGRHGETVISVKVYDNGRIGPLGVLRSSGYPDIDQRIEQMVEAVGKFPPLPQVLQSASDDAAQIELTLRFPDALEGQ